MRSLIGIAFLLCIGLALGDAEYVERCSADLAVHAVAEDEVAAEPIVTEEQVSRMQVAADGSSDRPVLNIQLDEAGAERMYRHTGDNVGELIVVTCNDEEIWRATINAPFGDRFSVLLPE